MKPDSDNPEISQQNYMKLSTLASHKHTQKNLFKKKEKKHISKHIPHTALPCNCKMID
jgi:hypothetical protein